MNTAFLHGFSNKSNHPTVAYSMDSFMDTEPCQTDAQGTWSIKIGKSQASPSRLMSPGPSKELTECDRNHAPHTTVHNLPTTINYCIYKAVCEYIWWKETGILSLSVELCPGLIDLYLPRLRLNNAFKLLTVLTSIHLLRVWRWLAFWWESFMYASQA